jgi:enterochelin esterase-like enzyme
MRDTKSLVWLSLPLMILMAGYASGAMLTPAAFTAPPAEGASGILGSDRTGFPIPVRSQGPQSRMGPLADTPRPAAGPQPSLTATSAPACAEDGVVRSGSAAGAEGFTIPFQVYLPPCYEKQTSVSYPVLYLISPDETAWLRYGRVAETANWMIHTGEISPFIVVTPRIDFYRVDTLFADCADMLVPYVDAHFRTLTDRRHRAVAGGSGAGDMASCLAFMYPDLFENAGAFAGGWCLDRQDLIDAMPAGQRPRVFMDTGDRDTATVHSMPLWAKVLAENGFHFVLNIGPGDHSLEYWSSNLEMYLRWWAAAW